MDEETDEIETLLKRWQPRAPRDEVSRRIALDLECPSVPWRWWQRLGFNHPAAALGWGLALPACLVLGAFQLVSLTTSVPSLPPVVRPSLAAIPARATELLPVAATNRRLATEDEGVVLDDHQRPVRRTRYRSEDTLAWRDATTGASLEFSYPREDVVMVPIATR